MNPQTPDLALRDIHLPDSVSWWPPAPGWWIVMGLCLLIALLFIWLKKRSQKIILPHEVRKEFEQLLQSYEQHANGQQLLRDLNALLRRTVLSYYPRKNVAGLTGKAWIRQLHLLSHTAVFDADTQSLLTQGAYMATAPANLQPLIEQLRNWIEHLPRQRDPEQAEVTPTC